MADSGLQEAAGARRWELPRVRWPYAVAFAVGSIGLGLGYAAFCALLGYRGAILAPEQPLGLARDTRTAFVIGSLLAFLGVVRLYERSRNDFQQLRLQTGMTPEVFGDRVRAPPAAPGRIALAIALGVLVGVGMVPASAEDPSFVLRVAEWDAPLLWTLGLNAVLFGLLGYTLYEGVHQGDLADRVVAALPPPDLLDRAALAPFSRLGLRSAFYWVGGSSIASLLALDLDRVGPLIGILTVTLAFSTLAFLQPARAIRRRIARAKQSELSRVRARIGRAKERALGGGTAADPPAGDLPGLLAWEARLLEVSEWPFDMGTRVRFAGLVLLAVGSWLGGAVVERALGLVIG